MDTYNESVIFVYAHPDSLLDNPAGYRCHIFVMTAFRPSHNPQRPFIYSPLEV